MPMKRKNYYKDVDIPFNNVQSKKANQKLMVLRTIFTVLCAFALLVLGLAIYNTVTGKNVRVPFLPAKKENILLIGVDGDIDNNLSKNHTRQNGRSDTLILFNIDTRTNTVNAISIPRDSKVYIANSNDIDKINHAFAFGGPQLTVSTIEDTFGIRIDHYIAVNYNVLKEIVAAVGGVNVYVPKNMHYNDYSAHLHINLRKGEQTLDPDTAEEFLRFRHDALGDIGRIERQQAFITGLIKKFQDPAIIPKIPEIIRIVQNNVLTDMNMYELSETAAYMQGANLSQMQITTLPGTPSQKGSISYWILDPVEVQSIIDKFIYRVDQNYKTQGLDVGIAYNPNYANKAQKVIRQLEESGNRVTCSVETDSQEPKIISHTNDVTLGTANYIKSKVSPIRKYPFVLSPGMGQVCGKNDISIVVSEY